MGKAHVGNMVGVGCQNYIYANIGIVLFDVFNCLENLRKQKQVFKVTSIITILGIINVPIIKYSVDWWNTLHQPASINILSKSTIHSSMLVPLLIMTAAFALFSLLIFLMKYNTELIKIKNKGLDRL